MMALVCLRMMTSVAIKNMGMQPLEPMLMLTQGAQTFDADEEDEQDVLILLKELICPRCWTIQTHQRWTTRKLAMLQGEVIKEIHLV